MSRPLSCVLAVATAVLLASPSAFAATVVPAAPAVPPPIHYSLYDQAVDPATSAIKAAVAEATKRGFVDKRDRAGLQAFYAQTAYAPAWTADGKLSDRALAAIARLKRADSDGLDAGLYVNPDVAISTLAVAAPQTLPAAVIRLS